MEAGLRTREFVQQTESADEGTEPDAEAQLRVSGGYESEEGRVDRAGRDHENDHVSLPGAAAGYMSEPKKSTKALARLSILSKMPLEASW